MENNPLTEEKAIPRPELGCGSAYDCFYRLDVISAKRLLKDRILGRIAECEGISAYDVYNIAMREVLVHIDACFQIPDGDDKE
jgi:hypothetical protein